ncbi:hypothetical protein ACFL35_00155 [Candidatus Riflebacteria bacterium]
MKTIYLQIFVIILLTSRIIFFKEKDRDDAIRPTVVKAQSLTFYKAAKQSVKKVDSAIVYLKIHAATEEKVDLQNVDLENQHFLKIKIPVKKVLSEDEFQKEVQNIFLPLHSLNSMQNFNSQLKGEFKKFQQKQKYEDDGSEDLKKFLNPSLRFKTEDH